MAVLYISEFTNGAANIFTETVQMMPQPAILDQAVAIGVAVQSAAFNPHTRAVLLSPDVACCVVFGDDPTATTDNFRLPADSVTPFAVEPGQKVSVIAAAT